MALALVLGLHIVDLLPDDLWDPPVSGGDWALREAATTAVTSRIRTLNTGMDEAIIVVETSAAPQIAKLPPASIYGQV